MSAIIRSFRFYQLLCVLLICGAWPVVIHGQSVTAAVDTISISYNQAKANTLLWRVSGHGLAEPSYVFGTMHILCPEEASIPAEMAAAFLVSQQIVLEIDMDELEHAKRTRRAAKLPWPISLRSVTKQRDFKVLRQFFRQQLHQSILPFVSVQPVLIEALVANSAFPCAPVSYEEKFVELAKTQHKEVLGLETIEEQLPVLQLEGYRQQARSLVETVRSYDSIPPILQRMVATYQRQNVDELYQFAVDPRYNSGQGGVAELQARNRNWIPKMKSWMENRPTFFAVGAAHLGSSTGILHLLRLQGYQVDPIMMQSAAVK